MTKEKERKLVQGKDIKSLSYTAYYGDIKITAHLAGEKGIVRLTGKALLEALQKSDFVAVKKQKYFYLEERVP